MSGDDRKSTGGTAGFTALFVRRPIFALVVNTLIIVAGLAALNGIEIRELAAGRPAGGFGEYPV